ncbi:hypothetical protein L6R29_15145 [Myxococcota bacterium]|nr:hypothetical protein [Myxococcota bacterium]
MNTIQPQDFFPMLRQILSQPPSPNAWRSLRRLFALWAAGDEKELGLQYTRNHLQTWDNDLRVTFKIDPTDPFWTLARTLDISYTTDAYTFQESNLDAQSLTHLTGLRIRIDYWNQLSASMKKKWSHLRSLSLTHCAQHSRLSFQGTDLPHLQRLSLSHCDKLEHIDDIEPIAHLQSLRCQRLLLLQQASFLAHLPQLRSLHLHILPSLQSLQPFSLLPHLQHLFLGGFQTIHDLAPLAALTQLRSLFLSDTKFIRSLEPLVGLQQLRSLELRGGQRLSELDIDQHLPQLQQLTARSVPNIQQKTIHNTTLRALYLSHLYKLQVLSIFDAPQLQHLTLKHAPALTRFELHHLPTELSHLSIINSRDGRLDVQSNRHQETQEHLQRIARIGL